MSEILGIMTHAIKNPDHFRRHARAAIGESFAGVLLYTPQGVDLHNKQIRGYLFRDGSWSKKNAAYPKINLDIGFYPSSSLRKASKVKAHKELSFTAYGLGNKSKIQKHLVASSFLKPYLLPTERVQTSAQFTDFLEKHRSVMLKPINGWGGKGIIRVTLEKNRFQVEQNNKKTVRLPLSRLSSFLHGVLSRGGRHIMQKWIDIRNSEGSVYDIRALAQKNGEGKWQTTGTAVREGKRGVITSNIKSGGHAYDVERYLKKQFNNEKAEALTKSIAEVASYIPPYMEKSYNTRLSELGIDLAVDSSGRLWLLEVNIKPGKSIMKMVYGQNAWEQSFRLPFQNARHMLKAK